MTRTFNGKEREAVLLQLLIVHVRCNIAGNLRIDKPRPPWLYDWEPKRRGPPFVAFVRDAGIHVAVEDEHLNLWDQRFFVVWKQRARIRAVLDAATNVPRFLGNGDVERILDDWVIKVNRGGTSIDAAVRAALKGIGKKEGEKTKKKGKERKGKKRKKEKKEEDVRKTLKFSK